MVTLLTDEQVCKCFWPNIELVDGFHTLKSSRGMRVAYNGPKLVKTFLHDNDTTIWNKLRVLAEDQISADTRVLEITTANGD